MKLITAILLAALMLLTRSCASGAANPPQNEPDTANRPVGEVPFRLLNGYLIEMEGQIGTRDHLRFLLDTGTSMSMLDSRIADGLKLNYQTARSFNFDRTLEWRKATLPDVRLGPIRAANLVMLVGHLADYSKFSRNVDAIIGTDVLKSTNLTIDFDARKVTFHSFNQTSSPRTADPLSNCVFLEIRVHDQPVRLIVDTGFPGIFFFEERLTAAAPNLEVQEKPRKVTIGERLHAKQATLRDIAIGSTRRDVSVLLGQSPAAEVLPGIAGVAGISALNAHRVNLNFVERTISWQ